MILEVGTCVASVGLAQPDHAAHQGRHCLSLIRGPWPVRGVFVLLTAVDVEILYVVVLPRRVFVSHTSELSRFRQGGQLWRQRRRDCGDGVFRTPRAAASAGLLEYGAIGGCVCAVVGFRYGSPVADRPELSYTSARHEASALHLIKLWWTRQRHFSATEW
jgi:hypothetical protein